MAWQQWTGLRVPPCGPHCKERSSAVCHSLPSLLNVLLGFIGFPVSWKQKLPQYAPLPCQQQSGSVARHRLGNTVPGMTSKQSLWSITTQICLNFAGSTPGRSSGISCRKPRELLGKDKSSARRCPAHLPASQHWLLQANLTERRRTLVDHAHQIHDRLKMPANAMLLRAGHGVLRASGETSARQSQSRQLRAFEQHLQRVKDQDQSHLSACS